MYAYTSKIAKNINAKAIINLTARGFTNDGYDYENIDVANCNIQNARFYA